MNDLFRPRRSMLYVPGCNERYINKARSLLVDSVILDLGNPILIEAKAEARRNVVAAVKEGGFGSREVVVRVNDIDSPWGKDDIYAVANIGADAILFPNIESRADVMTVLDILKDAGNTTSPIMVMIESPLGVLHAEEIASASDRIACMVMATSDLLSHLRGRITLERLPLLTSLSMVQLAARAHGRSIGHGAAGLSGHCAGCGCDAILFGDADWYLRHDLDHRLGFSHQLPALWHSLFLCRHVASSSRIGRGGGCLWRVTFPRLSACCFPAAGALTCGGLALHFLARHTRADFACAFVRPIFADHGGCYV